MYESEHEDDDGFSEQSSDVDNDSVSETFVDDVDGEGVDLELEDEDGEKDSIITAEAITIPNGRGSRPKLKMKQRKQRYQYGEPLHYPKPIPGYYITRLDEGTGALAKAQTQTEAKPQDRYAMWSHACRILELEKIRTDSQKTTDSKENGAC
jgi:hypothetical protein